MLTIRPDPAHPRGGYAVIGLDAAKVPGAEVSLTLYNGFNEKYLGEDGWQSEKAFFGPYTVKVDADRAEFVVGTEIVNQVEEYTPLVVAVGEAEFDISWPDDLMPGPPAATVGGVSSAPPKLSGRDGPNLVGKAKDPAPVEDPVKDPEPPVAVELPDPSENAGKDKTADPQNGSKSGGRSVGLVVGSAVLALLVAGALWWFLGQGEPEPVAEEPAPEPVPVAETQASPADPCSTDGLAATVADGGYTALLGQLQDCDGAVTADTALGYLEEGVDAGDPAALAALGRLYDDTQDIDVVETRMGLTFADNPAQAAEYYSRAVAAGDGVGAAEALGAVCDRLTGETDTLSRGAVQDYCTQ